MAAFAAAVGRLRAAVDAAVGGAGDASAAADEIARAITTDPDKDALTQATRASLEPAMEGALGALEARAAATLDVTLELVARDLADPRLPLTLVEDMLESRVTSECETLFMLLEARRSALLTVVGGSTNAKLVFLRACNELLRRLSKTKNTNFCGRILMLMAYLLPLSERSGVNVKGAVNVNPLELDETAEPSDAAAETDGTGAPASAGGAPSLGAPADGEFYRTFWGVQAAFQQPALALADADAWAATCRRLQTILGAFQASSTRDAPDTRVAGRGGAGGEAEAFRRAGDLAREIDVVAARVAEEARAQAAAAAAASSTPAAAGSASGGAQPKRYSSEVYFSKFLTSARLIGLQVRDSYFRRHILAQVRGAPRAPPPRARHAPQHRRRARPRPALRRAKLTRRRALPAPARPPGQVCAFCQTVCVSSTKAAPMASVEQQADARKIASDASSLLAATGVRAPLVRLSTRRALSGGRRHAGCPRSAARSLRATPPPPPPPPARALTRAGPCAPRFAETVASLLRSEEHWVAWKRDGCPVFERKRAADLPPAAPAVDASRKRASFAQEEGKAAEKRRRVQLGSVELTRLWNLGGDSLEELAKQAERSRCVPCAPAPARALALASG